jgi:Flp pilus assembly protein TadD
LARQPSSSGRLAAGLDATSDGAARLQPQAEAGDSAEQGQNAVELAAEILMIQRALETEPNRADLHRKLGFLLARQGRTAEAATEFRKALQCGRSTL